MTPNNISGFVTYNLLTQTDERKMWILDNNITGCESKYPQLGGNFVVI